MNRNWALLPLVIAALLGLIMPVTAASADTISAELDGYQETTLTLDTPATGEFKAKIRSDGTVINYELSYRDTESAVTQAHIHFGRPAISGGIVLFLCTNLAPPTGVPTPQTCPAAPATITGTLTAADVIAVPGQGIQSGAAGLAEILKAIHAGATYANVHTVSRGSGEIRGQIDGHGRH